MQAIKNAEETKNKVDLELKDLEATLKNIETARPFDELTVVRTEMELCWFGLGDICAHAIRAQRYDDYGTNDMAHRTKLLPLSPPLTRRPPTSFPRVAGTFLATRYVMTPLPWAMNIMANVIQMLTHRRVGEIRRSFRTIENGLTSNAEVMTSSLPICTLAL